MWVAIAAAAIQAIGAIKQGQAASENYKAQNKAHDYNAAVSRNQERATLLASTSEQTAQNRKARQIQGQQRAAIAQSGLGFTGSNADMLERSETMSELDQLNIAYDGATKARGFAQQADLDDFYGRVAGYNAKKAKQAGMWGAAAAAFGGASDAYKMKSAAPRTTVSTAPSSRGITNGSRLGGSGAWGGYG